MGGALKKAYDKKMKKAISELSSAQLRDYLKNGFLMLGETKIEDGWLKVEKVFNEATQKNEGLGCASNMTSSVILNIVLDDNLKLLGLARELTNKI